MEQWLTALQLFNSAKTNLRAGETELAREIAPEIHNTLCQAAAATETLSQMLLKLLEWRAIEALALMVKHGVSVIGGYDMLMFINSIESLDDLEFFSGTVTLIEQVGLGIEFPDEAIDTAVVRILNKIFHYARSKDVYGCITSKLYVNKCFTISNAYSDNARYARLLAVTRPHADLVDKTATVPHLNVRRWLARRGLI